MICIVDYGVGNLFSLVSSISSLGFEVRVSSSKDDIEQASKIILPGVGAFEDAINKLKINNLDQIIIEQAKKGVPLLGICLGMQLLFERSFEFGCHQGLGLIKGDIVPIQDYVKNVKIPHIGWNKLKIIKNSPLFKYIKTGDYVYFVHSYFASTEEKYISSLTDYEIELTASCEYKNVFGCQFHPEKSGEVGLKILKAFLEM
ncbi:MAG: imidazole glycerol phosphate synthase subunit HisH [Bacilli bacterium]|nr:imidazole glycerol phosphate synthase subunit HisH [Bacilli bacterium]